MELNPASTAALLASTEGRALPLENRILATLALGGKDAAIGLARNDAPQVGICQLSQRFRSAE